MRKDKQLQQQLYEFQQDDADRFIATIEAHDLMEYSV